MSLRVFAPDLLDGRVVLLSGGGSGLGPAIAQAMTAVGTLVVICGCCSGSVLTCDGARDVWRGSFPTHDNVDASGAIVAEARSNGHTTERAST